jgi:hypothetical protein
MLKQETLDQWWNFDDPAGSEARFRTAAADESYDADERAELGTQLGRAIGLQGRYEEADALLDASPKRWWSSSWPSSGLSASGHPGSRRGPGRQPPSASNHSQPGPERFLRRPLVRPMKQSIDRPHTTKGQAP